MTSTTAPAAPRVVAPGQPVPERPRRLRGLDGLRGVAVLLVLVFHLWPDVAPGGFVGVSLFFTLSGFVITRGLLDEVEGTGRVDLRAFWGRRIRRLWPAAAVTLAVIAVVWSVAGWLTSEIAGDIAASFAQVANWRFLVSGAAYGANTDTSPVAHFWSLAIEEQFYLVLPLLILLFGRSRRSLVALFSTMVVVSVAATALNAGDTTVVYYSSFTRAAEIAFGGLLALAVARVPTRVRVGPATRATLGVFALVGVGGLVLVSRLSSLGTESYYSGGLTALALLSVVAIVAAIWHPRTRRLLSIRPLVWLGAVSYGVYLVHWPLKLALEQTSLPTWLQPWVTLGLTLGIAALSFRFLEQPVRQRRLPRVVTLPAAAVLTALIVVVCLVGVRETAPSAGIDFTPVAESDVASVPTVPADPKGSATNPVRVATFGDSTALTLGIGLGGGDAGILNQRGSAVMACPIGRGGSMRGGASTGNSSRYPATEVAANCDWATQWTAAVQHAGGLDVALVLGGNWDIAGRKVPAVGSWATAGDPAYDAWLATELAGAADALHAAGATKVVWLTLPAEAGTEGNARVDRFNELLSGVAAVRPWMVLADYAGELAASGNDLAWRPDGVHLSNSTPDSGAQELSRVWLNDVLKQAAAAGS